VPDSESTAFLTRSTVEACLQNAGHICGTQIVKMQALDLGLFADNRPVVFNPIYAAENQ
jgi:hypothetical protein